MAGWGKYGRTRIGCSPPCVLVCANGVTTYAMATLNVGWCARFTARDTRDIKTCYANFSASASPGVVTCRIETIDAATGKPSGTLYDANATKAITPAAGWNAFTFDTLPTTGLVAGTEYAIVLLTTTGGTTQTLRAYNVSDTSIPAYPGVVLTAADGTTRSNFAEVANAVAYGSIVFEDDSEESIGMYGGPVRGSDTIYGTKAVGGKFTSVSTIMAAGVDVFFVPKTGSPGDTRFRLLDSSNNVLAARTVDKDSLANLNNRSAFVPFNAPVSLAAGTYRVIMDQNGAGDASNCWTLYRATHRSSATVVSGMIATSTADYTASPPTWTDLATDEPAIALVIDDITVSGGAVGILEG